jgi:hypothetical protein
MRDRKKVLKMPKNILNLGSTIPLCIVGPLGRHPSALHNKVLFEFMLIHLNSIDGSNQEKYKN